MAKILTDNLDTEKYDNFVEEYQTNSWADLGVEIRRGRPKFSNKEELEPITILIPSSWKTKIEKTGVNRSEFCRRALMKELASMETV